MRLWVFDTPVCRIGFVDDILGSYFLGSDWGLPWCYPRWAWFSATSLWHCQINQTHVKPRDLDTKLISIYFSWCSFQTFYKKLTCLSRAARTGGGCWENREEVLSNRRFLIQFFVKLSSMELSWERGDKYLSQLVCKWAGVFEFWIC